MAAVNNPRAYTRTAQALHWLMAAVIVVVWGVGYLGSEAAPGPGSPKAALINFHKSVAIIVLLLAVMRLLWRCKNAPPALISASALTRFAAHVGHWLLYALMILMPITGWAWTSAAARPVALLGLLELPALLEADADAKALLGDVHRTLAWTTAIVVAGHVLFALKHWLIDKDDVLQSMLTRRR